MRVAFVHPDLGIGGAERLVVDAAVGLQSCGHSVIIYTSHHDPSHSFPETNDGIPSLLIHRLVCILSYSNRNGKGSRSRRLDSSSLVRQRTRSIRYSSINLSRILHSYRGNVVRWQEIRRVCRGSAIRADSYFTIVAVLSNCVLLPLS
jgi:hypothetical protein